MVKGLLDLHRKNIIHHNIRSDIILANPTGQIEISDFEYSKFLTKQEEVCYDTNGTVCWIAPEKIKKEGCNTKSDVWSLGIFCIELTSGEPPYISEPYVRTLKNIIDNEPPHLDSIKWSPEFQDFVSKCLRKD